MATLNSLHKNTYLITLQLSNDSNSLDSVKRNFPELERELSIDEEYGLPNISPKRGLYVMRASGNIDSDRLMSLGLRGGSKIKSIHGDAQMAFL